MFSPRFFLGLLLFPISATALAQMEQTFDYRRFLTPPKTTPEFWEAMQFEMEVGRFDLAAQHLRGLIDKKPTQDELLKLHSKEGIATFLRLRLVPKWSDDRVREKQAREDVETLIELVTKAVRDKLTDVPRIKLYIENLYKTPEENAFARIELAKSGTAAVPYMLEELQRRPNLEREPIISALSQFGPDTVRPLLAALDIPDDVLRSNILEILRKRKDLFQLRSRDIDVAPALWPLVSPVLNKNETVRRQAREILTYINGLRHADQLPLPLVALTEEAEGYYYHRVRFSDPRRVALWRWDGKKLIEDTSMSPSKAEEFLALRYLRQALQINPKYHEAQVLMLGLLADKGYQAPTPDQPLGVLRPTVADLYLTMKSDLLNTVLENALRDERTLVALAAIKALGKIGDAHALIPQTQGEPALVQAMRYGDRRVQLAAVDAILRIPGAASLPAASQMVKILIGTLAPDAAASNKPRILVASSNDLSLRQMAKAVEQTGAEAVTSITGRGAVQRLLARSDIDSVILDTSLVQPDLTWVLAQLRSDQGLRRLPVLVGVLPDNFYVRDIINQMTDLRAKAQVLDAEIKKRLEEQERQEKLSSYEAARNRMDIFLEDARKKRAQLDGKLQTLTDRYEAEVQKREAALKSHLSKSKHVWPVSTNQLTDGRQLAVLLEERIREAGMPPLSKAERKEYAESSLAWLAKMATGELPGFDVRPAGDAVRGVLQTPGLSEAAQLNAIRILGRIPGEAAQRQLIYLVRDDKRTTPVRILATEQLLKHMEEFGRPDTEQEKVLQAAAELAVKQPGIDPILRDHLTRLLGALRPGGKATGQKLRDFIP
jgi:CheY-like chemotaxis protein